MSGTRIGEYPVCIGIDVHKRYSYAAVVDELGEIKEEMRIENTKESLEQFASKYKGARVVIEATNNWPCFIILGISPPPYNPYQPTSQ